MLPCRKASVLEAIGQVERTPPESKSGACTQRGSLGTREDRHLLVREQPEQYGEPVDLRARRQWAVPSLRARRERDTNRMGASEVSGSERQRDATRDGDAVVLAEHSSEGRVSGREGGEERPNRPTGAKAKPGITFLPEGEMRDIQKSPIISTQLRQIAQAKRLRNRTRCSSPWPTEWMRTFFMRPTVGCARTGRQG